MDFPPFCCSHTHVSNPYLPQRKKVNKSPPIMPPIPDPRQQKAVLFEFLKTYYVKPNGEVDVQALDRDTERVFGIPPPPPKVLKSVNNVVDTNLA